MDRRMKLIVLITLSLGLVSQLLAEDVVLRQGCVAHFSSPAEAGEILGQKDDFIEQLSPFDRSARMKTNESVSPEEFLGFVKANAGEWPEADQAKLRRAIGELRPALEQLPITFPKKISLVKTTGAEEGNAFYTRDTAIMIPEKEATANEERLKKTIAHELFHILSRNNPELREKLYRVIGFVKCNEIVFPEELKSRKITNPDAPRNNHSIRVRVNGKDLDVVPILFANSSNYDRSKGGEFFNYLQLGFLPLSKSSASKSQVLQLQQMSGFFEQVGRNTQYIIHPEEILADNFALLMLGEHDVQSPQILEKMRAVLESK
jgi:hypothetical protein